MRNFLVTTLRIFGWLFAMIIALAASSASVIYAYRYGASLAASEPQPWLTGAMLAIADIVKVGLPALMVALWSRSHRATARMLSVVFAMLVGLSLWATTSITAIERAANDAKATSASKLEADLRAELASARDRIAELGSPPPLAAVEAEIDGFKTDARWRTTEACDPLHVTPSTRRFCGEAALRQSARANAAEADKLRTRIDEIRRTLISPSPDAEKPASPELAVIADVSGWKAQNIGFGRAVFFALALELLGAFVPSAVWFLRPTCVAISPTSVSAPRPARVADARRKTSPSATDPVPTSPRPVRRGEKTRRGTGHKTGRSNLISFAEAFAERHGRPPTTTELKQEFPRASTTTAWRAIKDATNGMACNVHGNEMTA